MRFFLSGSGLSVSEQQGERRQGGPQGFCLQPTGVCEVLVQPVLLSNVHMNWGGRRVLVKCRFSVGMGQGLTVCVSNKIPGNAGAAVSWTTL